MVLGQIVSILGTVLLTRISIDMQYFLVAIYLVVSGIGFGMGLQMPFTGVHTVLRSDISRNLCSVYSLRPKQQ
jgi:hypothetical protein